MPKRCFDSPLLKLFVLGVLAFGSLRLDADEDVFMPLPATPIQTPQAFGVPMISDPSLFFAPPPESPFELGSFVMRPHFLYRFLYGDGVPSSPGHDLTTAINIFDPGILLNYGNWSLDYTPSWNLYSNSAFRDTVDENENFGGLIIFNASTLKLTQSYSYTSQPLIETGRQTTQQNLSEALDFTHRFSQEVFTETVLGENSRYAVGFPDSNDWSATDWLHYQFSSQLDTAIGADVGYIGVNEGSDIIYLDPQGQVTFSPSRKLSLNASGGIDHREFLEHPRVLLNNAIYNVSLQYNPFEWTGINLTAGREMNVSYFVNQSTRNTMWKAGFSQRVLGQFLFVGSVGQHDTDYILNLTAKGAGRDDDTLTYNIRMTWSFLRRGTFSILYLWNRNSSNVRGYGFSSHQVGFDVGYRY
jgi:hypothetical protein